jgi:hypothetical protein
MTTPLPSESDLLIWASTLDDKYLVQVQRTAHYSGALCIFDGEKTLLEQPVGLSYGAAFGPDISDVSDWEQRAVAFIDALPKAPA